MGVQRRAERAKRAARAKARAASPLQRHVRRRQLEVAHLAPLLQVSCDSATPERTTTLWRIERRVLRKSQLQLRSPRGGSRAQGFGGGKATGARARWQRMARRRLKRCGRGSDVARDYAFCATPELQVHLSRAHL